jgi:hypothetical protein
MGLDTLHSLERGGVAIAVNLQRDPRAVVKPEAEERADADVEREAVHCIGTQIADLPPDLLRIVSSEDRPLDRRTRPHSLRDELSHATALAIARYTRSEPSPWKRSISMNPRCR